MIQMTQQQLRDKAAAAGVEIELLPGKMVHTRKPKRVPTEAGRSSAETTHRPQNKMCMQVARTALKFGWH